VLRQGIALRPSDIDVVAVAGYGFPRHRGGPMHYADSVGLPRILADLREYAREDPAFWTPSPLLVELAEAGRDFASLNRAA
ncbi:MAG: 3-hydroxyacyl-CoA dehydrogenase, partial [Achromobacter sp.]|nr:3-hydroxyacyl-CoA dehydrogenase [Achromobacter sp.]